jgi:Protein of unknown function (DUF3141)
MQAPRTEGAMNPKTVTDIRTIADIWSGLYETWTRGLVSAWTLADTSDRKAPELSALAWRVAGFFAWQAVWDYWVDACQRTVVFWDMLRKRSEQYYAEKTKATPHVLSFDAELLLDGRTFERPVNYGLVRIKPPRGVVIEPKKRPFVVVDLRAGHGAGIAGFKADGELGVAMRAGHPCYFVGFTPDPMRGQTIEDIMCAEAVLGESDRAPSRRRRKAVRDRQLPGRLGGDDARRDQAGTVRPDHPGGLPGVLLGRAGRPEPDALQQWTPRRKLVDRAEQRPRRRQVRRRPSRGELRKSQPRQHAVDQELQGVGHVATEAQRFLDFEKWWGGHVNLNAEEIQWIVDQLFIGNRLATAEIVTRDGVRIDLRNVNSPIQKDEDILAQGQTIVYAIHESAGHLGIFVFGDVARKEHGEFASNIDLIDVLPPGLWEAVITRKTADAIHPELISGDWIARFERRTLNDIRVIVRPDRGNERRFATVRPRLRDQSRPVSHPAAIVCSGIGQRADGGMAT